MDTAAATFTKLIFERSGPVTTVTLNRPEVHNALDRELSSELNMAVRMVRDDRECRAFVLRGAGETFAPETTSRTSPRGSPTTPIGRSGSTRRPSRSSRI